ncbi:hypothetical protein [Psychromonas arctica]
MKSPFVMAIAEHIQMKTQRGYNSPTVKLSQTIKHFQQQQTGRLL